MNPFRSVGALLSLALSAVVVVALLIVYFMLVPSLQDRLVGSRLSELDSVAPQLAQRFNVTSPGTFGYGEFSDNARALTAADRIVIFERFAPFALRAVYDSNTNTSSVDVAEDPVAVAASSTGAITERLVTRRGARFAEVAIPNVRTQRVVLIIASLASQFETIHIVKRRLLISGLVALAVAFALGYGGAWAFARRIRRLEGAAERIASGQFDEPIVDPSKDELGELARAFDRMRVHVAQLDNARRAFIANASHELRTPLFSLGGFLELMDDEDLDDETREEFLITMREQVARLTRLATDLLDLSRVDAGRLRVDRQPLDLAPLAQTVADEFSAVALASDHPLALAQGNGAQALGDPERVLQIGRLLVENAILHTPPGTPVRLRVSADDGRAVLAVEDEGPGISAEHAEQVFERFYRADGGRSSGSGLGLAIARELAWLMDGTIELESRPGRTVFSLALPAAVEEVVPASLSS